MTIYYLLGPVGLSASALSGWSLYNAWAHGRVRSHGWVRRAEDPSFFWFIVVSTGLAGIWFGLIGLFVTADLLGLVRK